MAVFEELDCRSLGGQGSDIVKQSRLRGEISNQILEKPEWNLIQDDFYEQSTEILEREWESGILAGEDRALIPRCNLVHRQRADRPIKGEGENCTPFVQGERANRCSRS